MKKSTTLPPPIIAHPEFKNDLNAGMYMMGSYNYRVEKTSTSPDNFEFQILDSNTGAEIDTYQYEDSYTAHSDVLKAAKIYSLSFTHVY